MGTKGTWWRAHDKAEYDRNYPFPSPLFKREVDEVFAESGIDTDEADAISGMDLIRLESALEQHFGIYLEIVPNPGQETIYQRCWDGVRDCI